MYRASFLKHISRVVLLISLTGLSACSGVEIVGKSDTHVWIKNPALSIGDSDGLAQSYCSGLGKTAGLETDLSIAGGNSNILVYSCN